MTVTIAIVGRPNVGKSTLFNRLIGRRLALVDDQPGVTRDRREGEGQLYDLAFRVLDTAGLEDVTDASLEARMRRQTEVALAESDLALFLIDARAGVTPLDAHFAELLRRSPAKVLLVANKCEGREAEAGLGEAWSLGLGEPIGLSAEHALGIADLHDAITAALPEEKLEAARKAAEEGRRKSRAERRAESEAAAEAGAEAKAAAEEGEEEEGFDPIPEGQPDLLPDQPLYGPLQLAIVGRPNVGKSTLINNLLGEDRLLTGPEAGITRDSISVDWQYKDQPFRLVDTAGLRRRAKVTDRVERLSAADTKRSIDFAQVVVLLLDAQEGFEKQDLWIAGQVIEEGRGLVIGLNKWDAVEDRDETLRAVRDRLIRSLPQIKGVPVVPISGLAGKGLEKLLNVVLEVYDLWQSRISTSKLNEWLSEMTEAHPPPMAQGRRIKIRFMTQVKTRPPTFALWVSRPKDLPESYLRYLENGLRQAFDLPGIPLRFYMRKGENPYAGRRKKR
ncbi:MAG: ribosome biogenesis GTPase Der [Limibacillus sp.]|jgi:GTP-binding protein